MSKGAFALFSAGVINVTLAGALKATWKLLYAAGICDFASLDAMFFPVQSIGFLLTGVGILAMIVHPQGEGKAYAVAPAVFSGTFLFVGLMVAGLGVMDTVLCIICKKLGKSRIMAIFALSFVCSLAMGYLSGKNFANASANWIAEGVNVVGQGSLLAGVIALHKNGLSDLSLDKED